MKEIRVAIVGVGNCCSALVQGLTFYSREASPELPGLMHRLIGDYAIRDIVPVVAFDIDARKVGTDLSQAIFASPNNTHIFAAEIPYLDAPVLMGRVLDGVSPHMQNDTTLHFQVADDREPCDVVTELKTRKAEVLINYLPVGSREATRFYAQCAIDAGCAFVNAIPEFIASDPVWVEKFKKAGLPCLGDDIKSQYGATFSHRQILQGFIDRGIQIKSTSQENYAGNTDFLNMSDSVRIRSKPTSKTSSLVSLVPYTIPEPYAGPGVKGDSKHGFRPERKDRKMAIIKVDGIGFGGIPVNVELKVECEDSPNSAGIIIDAVRCAKLALDREVSGAITSPSSFFFKHPLDKCRDNEAKMRTEDFISGTREF